MKTTARNSQPISKVSSQTLSGADMQYDRSIRARFLRRVRQSKGHRADYLIGIQFYLKECCLPPLTKNTSLYLPSDIFRVRRNGDIVVLHNYHLEKASRQVDFTRAFTEASLSSVFTEDQSTDTTCGWAGWLPNPTNGIHLQEETIGYSEMQMRLQIDGWRCWNLLNSFVSRWRAVNEKVQTPVWLVEQTVRRTATLMLEMSDLEEWRHLPRVPGEVNCGLIARCHARWNDIEHTLLQQELIELDLNGAPFGKYMDAFRSGELAWQKGWHNWPRVVSALAKNAETFPEDD